MEVKEIKKDTMKQNNANNKISLFSRMECWKICIWTETSDKHGERSVHNINSIAKGQYRISNTGKTNTKCLSPTRTQLLSGEPKYFGNF